MLATVLIVATTLGVGGMGNAVVLGFVLVLMTAFFMADTTLILNGQYGPMNKDDYIFASMKLFADFILILTLVMQLFE
jgi:FtsH-binding integral membrane protein